MESMIEKLQEDGTGIPIRTVKSFMSKIPSVFIGSDLVQWLQKQLNCDDTSKNFYVRTLLYSSLRENFEICLKDEMLHFAHLLSSHGYIFPIDDHVLNVKNDNTFYRFQTPYYWPSNNIEPENTDYGMFFIQLRKQPN
jgi:regulator of G-protein signaling